MSCIRRRCIFFLGTVLFCTIGIWAIGFVSFLHMVPSNPPETLPKTDGIVVLTGGAMRVQAGLELLDQDDEAKLLISGVGKGITLQDLLPHYPLLGHAQTHNKLVLGYHAQNTRGNAEEAKEWAEEHAIKSMVLVTAYYHIPRAKMEFKQWLPNARIIPYPVFPQEAQNAGSLHPAGLRSLMYEYHKYILTCWRYWLLGNTV